MYTLKEFQSNQRFYFWFGVSIGVVWSFSAAALGLWVIGYLN